MFKPCVLLPLHSVQLVSVFPGHEQTSSPGTLHRTQEYGWLCRLQQLILALFFFL